MHAADETEPGVHVLTGNKLGRRGGLLDDSGGCELEEGCHEGMQQPLHCPGAALQTP